MKHWNDRVRLLLISLTEVITRKAAKNWNKDGVSISGLTFQPFMEITRSPLPRNQGKLPLPLFGGNFHGSFA